jgi:tight adherence protein C
MQRLFWILGGGWGAIVGLWAVRGVLLRSMSKVRIAEYLGLDEESTEWDDEGSRGLLGRWLALAGFRSRRAVGIFAACTIFMILAGLVLVLVVSRSRLVETAIWGLGNVPGAVGEIFVPVVRSGPWILVAIMGFAPWSVVRSRRRKIIMAVERDLPLVLELLATLAESGLGFDAAIARIIDAQPATSPLTVELRNFQRETLTGRPRVESLRRLAKRLDVQSLTIFISAIVHAEQVGTGVSEVLRRQADDVRDRRRDRALNLAQSLPVKLLFPLVICFLPAIFVFTLGPVFLQFFQFAEALLSRRSLR